jgi:hypothetical protein
MPYSFEQAAAMVLRVLQFPPAVIGWNRLEGRPRTANFDRALRAEVRDPLWFLTRQWQFGEFKGEDAGSPVDARTAMRVDALQHYAVDRSKAVAYDPATPLEAHVEREPMAFDLTLHAQVTRVFWRLSGAVATPAIRAGYLGVYPLPINPAAPGIDGVVDADSRHLLPLAASRVLDARKLLDEIDSGAHLTTIAGFTVASQRTALDQAGRDLSDWFHSQFSVPASAADDAWRKPFIEYQFAVATESDDRGQTVLAANQYKQGHLDWFAFDIEANRDVRLTRGDGTSATPAPSVKDPLSFIPVPVSFGGMPSHRYWEMESRQIEFANIDAQTTDVAKLLLTEFALVYGNDWCVIPYEINVGTISEAVGILVSDDFGEQSLLLPAGRGREDRWQRWSMFTLSHTTARGESDARLFLPPAVAKLVEGAPLEKVQFLRDEMANMAWGVERILPSALGQPMSGYVVSADATIPPAPPPMHATTAPVRYVLGTDVPYNWIPFVPVHISGSNRSIQLQRAQMPPISGGPSRKARGQILRGATPYYVNEEEVPRSGKLVTRGFQRARWMGGKTTTWIGRRVTSGRGEGSSGLAFDQVTDVPKK